MKYKIIVDKQPSTNPTSEKRTYEIDIEELRVKGNVYDSLIITKDEAYVMRRLSLSEYHVLSVLENEVKEPLTDLDLTLFEGDNYIYLVDMTGNKFYAEYLVKNDFNDIFCTRNEMNSAIVQSANQIELSVNQKLTGYSTTEEMNAIIQALANAISLEVSKKVDGEDFTSANIILMINNDQSQSKINADMIDINANDVLNILAGNEMNFTTKNLSIKSTNFSVNKEGEVTATSGNIGGFKLGKVNFTGALDGLYDYNEFDVRAVICYLLEAIGYNDILQDIFDVYSDGVVDSRDSLKVIKILNGTDINTKNMKGTFEINTTNPKNCISIKQDGKLAVSIGLGGINANLITANNIMCGYASTNSYSGMTVNGINGTIQMIDNNNRTLNISKDGKITCVSVTQTSEAAKKKNFEKLENALDIIKNIDIYKYNFKDEDDKTKKHMGFVIGENFKYREEVTSNKNNGVDLYSFVSLCCKAIQEEDIDFQELKTMVREQQKEINYLKERLEVLENG